VKPDHHTSFYVDGSIRPGTSIYQPAGHIGGRRRVTVRLTFDPLMFPRTGHELVIGYDAASNELYVDRVGLPVLGARARPGYVVAVFAEGGGATVPSLDVWQMRSPWLA
jgi:hypothetical protein